MCPPPLESDGNTLRKAVCWAILSLLAIFADSRGWKVANVPITFKYLVNLNLSNLSKHCKNIVVNRVSYCYNCVYDDSSCIAGFLQQVRFLP